jgi:hypothetical protein
MLRSGIVVVEGQPAAVRVMWQDAMRQIEPERDLALARGPRQAVRSQVFGGPVHPERVDTAWHQGEVGKLNEVTLH